MDTEKKRIKKIASKLLKENNITTFSFFGSVNTNSFNQNSDIDVLYELPTDTIITIFDLIRIKLEIEEATGRKVDLVDKTHIKPALKIFI